MSFSIQLFPVSCRGFSGPHLKSGNEASGQSFNQLLGLYMGLIMKHWLIEALLSVDNAPPPPPNM